MSLITRGEKTEAGDWEWDTFFFSLGQAGGREAKQTATGNANRNTAWSMHNAAAVSTHNANAVMCCGVGQRSPPQKQNPHLRLAF